jgi:FKBP-type peptidyl-prolyl cis-trans isomerase
MVMKRFALILAGVCLALSCSLVGCQKQQQEAKPDMTPKLQIVDEVVGTGPEAKDGDYLQVHYTGWIYHQGEKGPQFDSSRDRGEPWLFRLGRGKVIAGWDEGLVGMKVGGRRTLIIPPDKAYGEQGNARIPSNATLYFDVQLLDLPQPGIEDLVIGEGPTAEEGDRVAVHYTGWVSEKGERGQKFDSSVDRGQPFQFPIGAGHVIPGWDMGVKGMKVGGKRILTVPPILAYGKEGVVQGGEVLIPPKATLIFEVELLEVEGKR